MNWNKIDEVSNEIHAWANRTFPGRVPDSSLFKLVMEEIPELLAHKKEHGTQDIGLELADCFILLMDLAKIWKVDIAIAIRDKMEINNQRMWALDPSTRFYNHVVPKITVDQSDADTCRERARREGGNV